ncbi:MAG: SDR family oxidoreductase [Fibrobacterota bacterium]
MNRTVVVTGAGHRIGFYLAKTLLEHGWSVIAHYRKNTHSLQEWLENNPDYQCRVQWVRADLAQSVQPLTDAMGKCGASLQGLVNSAGLFYPADLTDTAAFDTLMRINCRVPHELSVAFSQQVGKGCIINISDGNIRRLNTTFQAYRMSKLMLEELTRQLAFCLAPQIRVNALAPGTVLPPEHRPREESFRAAQKRSLTKKAVSTEDITAGLHFLFKTPSVTGEVLSVDGGVHCR